MLSARSLRLFRWPLRAMQAGYHISIFPGLTSAILLSTNIPASSLSVENIAFQTDTV